MNKEQFSQVLYSPDDTSGGSLPENDSPLIDGEPTSFTDALKMCRVGAYLDVGLMEERVQLLVEQRKLSNSERLKRPFTARIDKYKHVIGHLKTQDYQESLYHLCISTDIFNALNRGGIHTITNLVSSMAVASAANPYDPFYVWVRKIGERSIMEIQATIKEFVELGGKVDEE